MRSWRSTLDVAANVGLIVCSVLFGIFLTKSYFLSNDKQPSEPDRLARSLVGKTLSLEGVEWARSQQTLLVVLQKGCRFCEESVPFYKRLASGLSDQTKTRLVALLPQSADESKQYLSARGLEITDIRQASLKSVGIRGTPTLLLVNSSGTVLEQWTGKLPANQEESVIARLKQ